MRLIDADALIKEAYVDVAYGYVDAKQIADAPTIDAVPVVRCKDCKHWEHGDCYRLELSRPGDFCSYGERKEGADNGC